MPIPHQERGSAAVNVKSMTYDVFENHSEQCFEIFALTSAPSTGGEMSALQQFAT
jgi:hypothetical protein